MRNIHVEKFDPVRQRAHRHCASDLTAIVSPFHALLSLGPSHETSKLSTRNPGDDNEFFETISVCRRERTSVKSGRADCRTVVGSEHASCRPDFVDGVRGQT